MLRPRRLSGPSDCGRTDSAGSVCTPRPAVARASGFCRADPRGVFGTVPNRLNPSRRNCHSERWMGAGHSGSSAAVTTSNKSGDAVLKRNAIRLAAVAGAALLAFGIAPSQASADTSVDKSVAAAEGPIVPVESDLAESFGPPGQEALCTYANIAAGCFRPYGDVLYVQDSRANLSSPYLHWQNQLRGPNGSWTLYRAGKCWNMLDAPNWGICNKDFYEHSTVRSDGGKGSQLRWRLCSPAAAGNDSCTAWTGWINNDQ